MRSLGTLVAVSLLAATIGRSAAFFVATHPPAVRAAEGVWKGCRGQSQCRVVPRTRMQLGEGDESARLAAKEAFVAAALGGPKNGVGCTTDQRADIEAKLNALCSFNPTKEPAYALLRPPFPYFDGTYGLVYTNTSGGSSGKLGPFVLDVTQTFEGIRDIDQMGFSRRGIFSNGGSLGPLQTSLRARCEAKTESKLNIVFEEMSLSLFGVQVQNKKFDPNGKGTKGSWDLRYVDEDLKVIRTNAGNVLALQKVAPLGGESYMDKQKRLGSQPY
uniref:Plastid lipid-associated protein/fibrillin conserved domain-containing protein n=1 Tax=Hemiselmis tepida TaxID=464990 RepID=A0A7S0VS46_9CRYP|mmetsp:Transcript_18675/g.47116  ORF Transcript_18675/g.47116 Transcript_18675/m.47116 type:complete len:273 (+) Transcript_18675:45-863(+)|eukprot:CAMPEP_0174935004 /NCGR_PEP_ID=MMETSP1355-20121228/51782_1 /TAXON_ID=464990 /ORGANISM="Hemiselmis tepida, Strain CCMP443" /LENGTH=272 /DNA_ID=CAMNT_0016181657 /DNA_START=38 /DNA_END=856 /DNA_ORIENTATION=-